MTPDQIAWRAAHHTPWYERIGDGDPLGLTTSLFYLVAALLCLRAARRSVGEAGPARALWLAAGAVLLALGINKQLDLQVALIELGRDLALAQGWYGMRRAVQFGAFAIGLAGAAGAALWVLPLVWRQGARLRIAFAGLGLIGLYVCLRAAKFQHIVWTPPGAPDGPGWLALFELSGLALVTVAAWRARPAPR